MDGGRGRVPESEETETRLNKANISDKKGNLKNNLASSELGRGIPGGKKEFLMENAERVRCDSLVEGPEAPNSEETTSKKK